MDQAYLLIKQMKRGDEAAMEEFVRNYYPSVLKYCGCHVSDRETARDLTQETFERFFRGLAGYRFQGKDQNYLYVIAGNLCRDFYKKKLPIAGLNVEKPQGEALTTARGEAYGGAGDVDKRLDMEKALQALCPEFREVIILYYFQEFRMKEISRILEIGLPLVKYRLRMAKRQLKEILLKEEGSWI